MFDLRMNYRSSVCRQCLMCVWIIDPVFVDSVWFVYELNSVCLQLFDLCMNYTHPVFVDSVW